MRNSGQKLIYMLWGVITVLVVGGGIIAFMLLHKADELDQTNNQLTGSNSSLREQLRQAKASPTPRPTPTPDYSASATPTPSPAATATPKPPTSR
ncbi:MAG: hypothetical protein JWN01_636 [Patescibacteria group bacterium]|nr:hypothetical protein [Patescibacteria group bacterium]